MKAIASTRSRSAALTTVAGTIAGHSHDDWKAQRSRCARVSSNSRHVNSARVIPANSPSNSCCRGFNAGSRISEIGRPWLAR